MTIVYVDADACPVKDEVYKVAARHGVDVVVVANRFMVTPRETFVRFELAPEGPDAADDWIAERCGDGDVVVTADIPLASRCLPKGAAVLGPTGRPFTDSSIGSALATRELMSHLREIGVAGGGPRPFGPQDRSRFLQALDIAVRRGLAKGRTPA
ncbi:YaiI/YqxD family protein [Methylopila musalis]|uniref:UPF0178 protein ACFQ4O_15430 n=1 Tax=Methylopila musalis TaxID=1134781 RepID=A0ABW3ZBA8_9HYPH